MKQSEEESEFKNYTDAQIEEEAFDYVSWGLTPFSSKETRDNGRRLILVSLLSLLVSARIICISKGNFLGIEFNFSTPKYLIGIGIIVCIYLLILYLFDILQERKMWNKKSEDLKTNKKDFFYQPIRDSMERRGNDLAQMIATHEEEQLVLKKKLALEDVFVDEHDGMGFVERTKIYDKYQEDFQAKLKVYSNNSTALFNIVNERVAKLETIFNQSKKNYETRTLIEITIPILFTTVAILKGILYYF